MTQKLTRIQIFPTGMRLHEWIAFEEGYFRDEGLDPEVMMEVYLAQQGGRAATRTDRKTNVPVAVGLMAGSHYNVPYRLEQYLPLEEIKIDPVGGFRPAPRGPAQRRG